MIQVTFSLPHILTGDTATVRFQNALTNQGQSPWHKVPRLWGGTHRPFPSRTITLVNDWLMLTLSKTGCKGTSPWLWSDFQETAVLTFHTSLLPHALKDNTEESLPLVFSSRELLHQPMLIYYACHQVRCFWRSRCDNVILAVICPHPTSPRLALTTKAGGWTAWREESSGWQKMSVFTLWLSRMRPPLMPSLPSQFSFLPTILPHQLGLASC